MAIQVQHLGETVSGKELSDLSTHYEKKNNCKKGDFAKWLKESETSESARWKVLLNSDFNLYVVAPEEVAA